MPSFPRQATNFATLDPALQARGIKGLANVSNANRQIWDEFAANPEALAADAEEAAARIGLGAAVPPDSVEIEVPEGETEATPVIRARRVQSFFRAAVLTTYETKCAITGITIPALLTASHIIPWSQSVERRAGSTQRHLP